MFYSVDIRRSFKYLKQPRANGVVCSAFTIHFYAASPPLGRWIIDAIINLNVVSWLLFKHFFFDSSFLRKQTKQLATGDRTISRAVIFFGKEEGRRRKQKEKRREYRSQDGSVVDEFKLVGRGFGKRSNGRPELYYRVVDDVAGGRGPPSAALLRISGRAASFRRWRLCPLHSARRSGQFHHHRRTPALHQSKFVFVFISPRYCEVKCLVRLPLSRITSLVMLSRSRSSGRHDIPLHVTITSG